MELAEAPPGQKEVGGAGSLKLPEPGAARVLRGTARAEVG